jgi:hypothetical protein
MIGNETGNVWFSRLFVSNQKWSNRSRNKSLPLAIALLWDYEAAMVAFSNSDVCYLIQSF